MALDGAVDLIEVIARFFRRIVSEVLVEFLCKGMGFLICRKFKKDIDPDVFMVIIVGFLFLVIFAVLVFSTYETLVNK